MNTGAVDWAIRVTSVTKEFDVGKGPAVKALDSIDLEVSSGELVVLLGPSGCGKTTLLRMIGGLEPPTAGEIEVSPNDGGQVGFVFQDATLMPWRSALKNVELPMELQGMGRHERQTRAKELLELVGLRGSELKSPSQLSGGMRQRVSIARALAHDPPVLLMDEPFGALDAQTRDSMNIELQRIWMESGKTIVFVTHSVEEAVFLADRIILLRSHPGQIQSISEIGFQRPRGPSLTEAPEFREQVRSLRSAIGSGAPDIDLMNPANAEVS